MSLNDEAAAREQNRAAADLEVTLEARGRQTIPLTAVTVLEPDRPLNRWGDSQGKGPGMDPHH